MTYRKRSATCMQKKEEREKEQRQREPGRGKNTQPTGTNANLEPIGIAVEEAEHGNA